MIPYILGITHTAWHASGGAQDHRVYRAIRSLHVEAGEARMFLLPWVASWHAGLYVGQGEKHSK